MHTPFGSPVDPDVKIIYTILFFFLEIFFVLSKFSKKFKFLMFTTLFFF